MGYRIQCSACGQPSHNLLDYRCSRCGRPLDVRVDGIFNEKRIQVSNKTVWRYSEFFPYVKEANIMTLGEGWTPLVKLNENVHLKLESLNPTGSFKDRGSTALLSAIWRQIKETSSYIAEDSSGNAGASIAAYSARAGLKAEIYVPENVSGPKFNQIQFYGASITRVAGSRSGVAEEAQKPRKGKFYVGHILHPLFRDGIRNLAYEIAEQFGWGIPERVYLPVSAGTLLLGVVRGFSHLVDSNVIEDVPKIVACQTRQVSPLYHRIKSLTYKPTEKITSIADALVSTDPPLLNLMVESLNEAKGDAEIVDENEIFDAFIELAKKGFFVEPSSAVAYAAYKKQVRNREVSKSERVVIILTGHGLKTAIEPK